MLKKYFYCFEALLVSCIITNVYSYFHRPFFRSPFSIVVNIISPLAALVYLVLIIRHKKKLKKKVDAKYQKFFSKN